MSARKNVDRPFAFGRNWQRFIENSLDDERIARAAQSLSDLIPEDLAGRTFLDIGCGSGLFSFCAHQAGAASVVSIDVDPDSVEATTQLRRRAGDPETWTISHGSILDPAFVEDLAEADVVYSWGVLHHTGDMYPAIRAASTKVRPGGVFCIAIYNLVTDRFIDSRRWTKIKRTYSRSPRPVQRVMEAAYVASWVLGQLRGRQNPMRVAREYKARRGMAVVTDLIDWLGGYPYEAATADDIVAFCRDACRLELVKLVPVPAGYFGNNQFVFRRAG